MYTETAAALLTDRLTINQPTNKQTVTLKVISDIWFYFKMLTFERETVLQIRRH